MALNILIIGDVVGKLGRRTVASVLPDIRESKAVDLVIANGENAAGGRGMTAENATRSYAAPASTSSLPATTSGPSARSIPFWTTTPNR